MCGSVPNQDQLFEIMKATRNRFKYALRRVRKATDAIKAQKLFKAPLWGGGDLLAELRKTRGGGTHQTCRKVWLEPMGKNKSERNFDSFTVNYIVQLIQPMR